MGGLKLPQPNSVLVEVEAELGNIRTDSICNVSINISQTEIKEEGCLSEHLSPLDYARPYPSPDYTYYQRDYVGQDLQEKDIESRCVLFR